jgi:hypothetical protein
MRQRARKRTILLAVTSTHHVFCRGAARYAAEHYWHVVADIIYDATIPIGWSAWPATWSEFDTEDYANPQPT